AGHIIEVRPRLVVPALTIAVGNKVAGGDDEAGGCDRLGGDAIGPDLVDHGLLDLRGAGHLELVDIQSLEHVALDLRRLPRAAVPVPLAEGVAGGVHLDPEVAHDHALAGGGRGGAGDGV